MRKITPVVLASTAFMVTALGARASDASDLVSAQPPASAPAAPAAMQAASDTTALRVLRDKGIITQEEYDQYVSSLAPGPGTAPKEEAPIKFKYKPGGGFTFETADEKFGMTLGGYLQTRAEYFDLDSGRSAGDELRFSVKRARLDLQGWVFEKWVKYRIMIDAAGQDAVTSVNTDTDGNVTGSRDKVTELKDGYFDITPYEEFGARVGQYKVPFSRQQIISATRLQFPDRSITDDQFAHARDIGIDFHGALSGRFFYDAGVYNGNGENRPSNPDGTEMSYNGRVGLLVAGEDAKYLLEQEGDTKRTEDFLLALELGDDYNTGDADINTVEFSGIMKTHGFSAQASYFVRNRDLVDAESSDDNGYYGQIGFMLTDHVELALRRAGFDVEGTTEDSETSIGASYYFYEHNLKLQLAYSYLESDPDDGDDLQDNKFVLQLSARF